MTFRFGPQRIAGKFVFGRSDLGVPGASVPTSGGIGASPVLPLLTFPDDNAAQIRVRLGPIPVGLSFFMFEDTSGIASGADGVYDVPFRWERNGVEQPGDFEFRIVIGAASAAALSGTSASFASGAVGVATSASRVLAGTVATFSIGALNAAGGAARALTGTSAAFSIGNVGAEVPGLASLSGTTASFTLGTVSASGGDVQDPDEHYRTDVAAWVRWVSRRGAS